MLGPSSFSLLFFTLCSFLSSSLFLLTQSKYLCVAYRSLESSLFFTSFPEKCTPHGPFGGSWRFLGDFLGSAWATWAPLGASWGTLGFSGERLGGCWVPLGGCWRSTKNADSMVVFQWFRLWAPLGALLGPSWCILWTSWRLLAPSWEPLGASLGAA